MAPITVPHKALDTVQPRAPGERLYTCVSARVAPEMTAVSKPNSRPPSAATIVLLMMNGLSGAPSDLPVEVSLVFIESSSEFNGRLYQPTGSPVRYPQGVDAAGDRAFIQIVDAATAEAARRSGPWLACRPGCTQCCIGPFPITQLDA